MGKWVSLKLNNGSLQTGFSVSLQMGDEGASPTTEILGNLPAAPELYGMYRQWQVTYQQLSVPVRLGVSRVGFPTNVSYLDDCHNLAEQLQCAFNRWLRSESFRPVQDKFLEQLSPEDVIRLIVQTQQEMVQRLPWHLWDICDRYPNLEIALSAPIYDKKIPTVTANRERVRILAIFGDSRGLDIDTDLALLQHLPHAEIRCLTEPDRQTLDTHLWDTQGWDILFFAGHSATQPLTAPGSTTTDGLDSAQPTEQSEEKIEEKTKKKSDRKSDQQSNPKIEQQSKQQLEQQPLVGQLHINPTEVITIPQLKNALQHALSRGLKIAIFNSCEGLGLAHDLADLQIPQVLVMQEVVPDQVAHAFLKFFLAAFARGEPFYLAVREARKKLQALEDTFPCAAWLPTIYQNPANQPPCWQSLCKGSVALTSCDRTSTLWPLIFSHAIMTVAIIGLRYLGLFQAWELKAFDQLLRVRTKERPDARLVIVTITEDDIRRQAGENPRGSLSDQALLEILQQLEPMQPRVIGLDIYRDFPARPELPELAARMAANDAFVAVCKGSESRVNSSGIAPPPEVPDDRLGFSDFIVDVDAVLRRQLVAMTPEPASPCSSSYSLSARLALTYLSKEDITVQASPEGYLHMGDVIFTPMDSHQGGYRGADAWGHQILLNYRSLDSPDQIATKVTLTELRQGKVNPVLIRDRIVLIGTTAISFGDYWPTPYSKSPRVEHKTNGVFMQAQMTSHLLSAVLDHRPLIKTWPEWGETLWILSWGATGSLLISLSRLLVDNQQHYAIRHWLLILLGTELGVLAICGLLFTKAYYWVPWVPPAILLLAIIGSVPIAAYPMVSQFLPEPQER